MPLVLIVMTIETQQLPVTPVGRIVVMVVVLVVNGKLVQLLAVKVSSAMCADPWQKFEGKSSIGRFTMRDAAGHESLRSTGDSAPHYSTGDFMQKHAARQQPPERNKGATGSAHDGNSGRGRQRLRQLDLVTFPSLRCATSLDMSYQ